MTKTAGELALQGSGWACAVILGGWSFYLFKELRACDRRVGELLERVIVVAESSKASIAATATAVDGMGDSIGTLTQGVQALSREVAGDESETRHGVNNILEGQKGIAGRLEKLTERVMERARS